MPLFDCLVECFAQEEKACWEELDALHSTLEATQQASLASQRVLACRDAAGAVLIRSLSALNLAIPNLRSECNLNTRYSCCALITLTGRRWR